MSKKIKFSAEEIEKLIFNYQMELVDALEHVEHLRSVLSKLGAPWFHDSHEDFGGKKSLKDKKKKKEKKDKKKSKLLKGKQEIMPMDEEVVAVEPVPSVKVPARRGRKPRVKEAPAKEAPVAEVSAEKVVLPTVEEKPAARERKRRPRIPAVKAEVVTPPVEVPKPLKEKKVKPAAKKEGKPAPKRKAAAVKPVKEKPVKEKLVKEKPVKEKPVKDQKPAKVAKEVKSPAVEPKRTSRKSTPLVRMSKIGGGKTPKKAAEPVAPPATEEIAPLPAETRE